MDIVKIYILIQNGYQNQENENETLQHSLEMKVRIQKLDQYQNKKTVKIVFFLNFSI